VLLPPFLAGRKLTQRHSFLSGPIPVCWCHESIPVIGVAFVRGTPGGRGWLDAW